ncbi:hypothetical protein [Ralstonia pseudosolanacearum]|uniref:hypothetical protein n=1 Tax=Ralstonia pseudosolanacearum TaxID=1310165 RepID=UPI00201D3369|nr:hypothetical protein [Ralstonia pseudosolanacearum]
MLFLFLLAGLTAGFFAGMFGIGGGAIVIPILVHVYRDAGMDMTEAIRLAFGTPRSRPWPSPGCRRISATGSAAMSTVPGCAS